MTNSRVIVISLIEKALEGKLGLEELHSSWPENPNNEFWNDLFSNLESGVEHFPYELFSNMPDHEMWHKSREYNNLRDYLQRLKLEDIENPPPL